MVVVVVVVVEWFGEIDFDNVETSKKNRGDSRILI
jgi:hypothetical protein